MDAAAQRVLGIFAKWPAPGAVKTRLSADANWNAAVARAFLLDTLHRLSHIAVRKIVAFTPPEAERDFRALTATQYELMSQAPGDLGQRLEAFFRSQLATGASAVVAVGSDSPTLPVDFVERAFHELQQADVVLGPAMDGGYYLLGCGRRLPPIFAGIRWGTGSVLKETTSALDDPNWRLNLLPPWYDVDTPTDWELLGGHLTALRRAGMDPDVPHTEGLLRAGPGCGRET